MIYVKGIEKFSWEGPTAITIGKFDGIHRGHELLVSKIHAQAIHEMAAVMVTFDHSPRVILGKEAKDDRNLVTAAERSMLLSKQGLDFLVELPFSDEIIHMEAEDFVAMLCERLHMKYLVVGDDFHFGYQGRGDVALLAQLSKSMGFTLEVIEKLKDASREISSSYVREEIRRGEIHHANELLGHPYFVWGEITHGNHIGTGMGLPTINILPPSDKLLPPFGVYVTTVEVEGRVYHGITDVGTKPTVADGKDVVVETHILDFSSNIYGETAMIRFFEYVRPEMKFDSLDALKRQIEQDKKRAVQFFKTQ